MSNQKYFLVFVLICAMLLGACSRPKGDLGRPSHSFVHDKLNPAIGKRFAKYRKEPVSFFERTEEEKRLIDIVDDISRPLHVHDWISGSLIEGERSRIFPKINHHLKHEAYLFWLRREKFLSSETRWNRIIYDIRADQGLVHPFYAQARLVHTIDQERYEYLRENPHFKLKYQAATEARIAENEIYFQRALDSFLFRRDAYFHAIKHLTLETPSARAHIAMEELEKYKILIEAGGKRDLDFLKSEKHVASRVRDEDDKKEEKVPQK